MKSQGAEICVCSGDPPALQVDEQQGRQGKRQSLLCFLHQRFVARAV